MRQIGGLPNVIKHLTFSPDGKHLVATLGAANGIRVFRTVDGHQLAEDQEYSDDSYWADFDHTGRLVTSSWDGKILLYDSSFKLVKIEDAPGGERPFGVAFSPDGESIAVGYEDTTRVDVLDGATLEPLFEADTSSLTNGNLAVELLGPMMAVFFTLAVGPTYQTARAPPFGDGPMADVARFAILPSVKTRSAGIHPLEGWAHQLCQPKTPVLGCWTSMARKFGDETQTTLFSGDSKRISRSL